jgi:hypothetical protein
VHCAVHCAVCIAPSRMAHPGPSGPEALPGLSLICTTVVKHSLILAGNLNKNSCEVGLYLYCTGGYSALHTGIHSLALKLDRLNILNTVKQTE